MCSSGGARPSQNETPGSSVSRCPPPDFSVEIDLAETGDPDLLKPLDNTHYAMPTGGWRNWRDSKVRFDIEIDSDDRSFRADRTEVVVQRGGTVVFSQNFTSEMVARGDHEWLWDGFDNNDVLNTATLIGSGLNVTVNVRKSGVTRSATEALDNEPEKLDWLDVRVELNPRTVTANVYVNYQNEDNMPAATFNRLKGLVASGINRYWSRSISVGGTEYQVTTNVVERQNNSIDLDLYFETDTEFGRSHASGIIDTTLYYNHGFAHGNTAWADSDFKFTAAHEFGHTVLEESRGRGYSWGHKGTSNPILQTVYSSSPTYPTTGEIDLMYYYNGNQPTDFFSRVIAVEEDVKMLIWLCQVDFDEA
ncbi:MAG: hypothetical protein U9N60_04720 [Thermodesulfobacteriota bacterium]|nr:hypothetical protein [Thermodesulfobacteriota bacterium]